MGRVRHGYSEATDATTTGVDLPLDRSGAEDIAPDGGNEVSEDGGNERRVEPDYRSMLERYNDTTGVPLSHEDAILVERTLSLMGQQRSAVLRMRYGIGGERLSNQSIGRQLNRDGAGVATALSRARVKFERIASDYHNGRIDLKQWAEEHPYSKSVLALLACLDIEIPPGATMSDLNVLAANRLEQRRDRLNPSQVSIIKDLYGLEDSTPKPTSVVARRSGYTRNAIRNLESVVLGRQARDYHPDRESRHRY